MGQCELGVQRDGRTEMCERIGHHALPHRQDPETIVGPGIFRIDFQDLAEVRGSLRPLSQLAQEPAQIVVGLGIIGIDLDSAAVAGQGLLASPKLLQDVPQVIRGPRQIRLELERLFESGNGLLGPSFAA